MSEAGVKLIGECCKERLPCYVEKLIASVQAELADALTDYDLTVIILFGLMAETGFTPIGIDNILTGPMSPYGSSYDYKKLKAIQKMPKNWRTANGSTYSMKFHLNPCHDAVCQFLASKIEANTSNSIDDNLIVNLFVNCSSSAKAINIQPSRYVASKNAEIENMFDKLDELSTLFKNVVHPIRNTILEEFGRLNASLIGIPTEVKLRIFEYLRVPEDWRALSETCMDFHILGNDPNLWKSYLKRDFGMSANHKAGVDELMDSTKVVDWKMEYLGRYFYDYCKSSVTEGHPVPFWIQSPTTSRFLLDVQFIVSQNFPPEATEIAASFDADDSEDEPQGPCFDYYFTNAHGDYSSNRTNYFPRTNWQSQPRREPLASSSFNVDVLYNAGLNENDSTSGTEDNEGVFDNIPVQDRQDSELPCKSSVKNVVCESFYYEIPSHEDTIMSPDSLLDATDFGNFIESDTSLDTSSGSGVRERNYSYQYNAGNEVDEADFESYDAGAELDADRTCKIEDCYPPYWLRGQMPAWRNPFETDDGDDVTTVSSHNNVGSASDLDSVLMDLERNGNGDADFLEGVEPRDFTYKEIYENRFE